MLKTARAYFMSGILPAGLYAGLIADPGGGLENVALFLGWFLGVAACLTPLAKDGLEPPRTHLVWRQLRAGFICVTAAWGGHFALAAVLLIGSILTASATDKGQANRAAA